MSKTSEVRDGAEVSIEAGYGWVTKVEPKGRNARVEIRAEQLQIPVAGWVDTTNFELWERVQSAHAEACRVGYRVVVKRKPSVAPDRAIADLGNLEKVRDLEELVIARPADGPAPAAGTSPNPSPAPAAASVPPPSGDPDQVRLCAACGRSLAGSACRRRDGELVHAPDCPPAEDGPEQWGARQAAEDAAVRAGAGTVTRAPESSDADPPDGSVAAEAAGWLTQAGREATAQREALANRGAEEAPEAVFVCGWCDDEALPYSPFPDAAAVAAHMVEVHADVFAGLPPVPPAAAPGAPGPSVTDGKRGPRIAEARNFERYNQDGSRNLGSWEVLATEGMVLLAHDLLLEQARVQTKLEGIPFVSPTPGKVTGLARRLLKAADVAQAGLRPDGWVDRMAMSHTRCRGAVRVALEAHPVPWGADADQLEAWVAALADYATQLVKVTLALVEPEAGL